MDSPFLAALPDLARVHAQLDAALARHFQRGTNLQSEPPLPNIAEIALAANRHAGRLTAWMYSAGRNANPSNLPLKEIMALRSRIAEQLQNCKLVKDARVYDFASYLATNATPNVSSLTAFCAISAQTARVWLKKTAEANLICRLDTVNELFFINPDVLSILTNYEKVLIIRHFNLLTQKSGWLQRSRYLMNS